MSKKLKVTGLIVLLFLAVIIIGGVIYINMLPPGEQWISYQNDKLIASIENQLNGIDIDTVIKEKEDYIIEKSIDEIQEAVKNQRITYEEITAIYLYRIQTLDQKKHGYNSVVEINPNAIKQARERDLKRVNTPSSQETDSPLYGIPVMLKDNINTAEMPTSAGAVAFADFVPDKDAQLVQALKNQGAIILGKNNLSEFANYLSIEMPSGYSGKKGQTVNPFSPLKISPSGSSSGSAVAVTANLIPVSIGTETAGSIVGPASVNSVVGFKPSRGNVSGEGIFPLVSRLDMAGPIAKTVQDVTTAYNVISGKAISLDKSGDSLSGKTIGLITNEYNDKAMIKEIKKAFSDMNVQVVDIDNNEEGININNIIHLSFKKEFEAFAQAYNLPIKKLSELVAFNSEDAKRRIKYGQDLLEDANAVEQPDMDKMEDTIKRAGSVLGSYFQDNQLDGIAFLNTTGSSIASAAGYPELVIPFGKDKKGVPQGITFVTRAGEDEKALNFGYSFEKHSQRGRLVP